MSTPIDVAIPTYDGQGVIRDSLEALDQAIRDSPFVLNRVVVDYKRNGDVTDDVIDTWADYTGTECVIHENDHNLPEAREFLIEQIETDWFLFLDDDVMLRPDTVQSMHDSISPLTGAVQVKKGRQTDANHEWSKWRPVRGTTFATLLCADAVEGIDIPADMTVLEDEYLRQYVESESDYLWIFNHQAVIDHDNQGRHGIDAREGYLAGKYGLLPYDYVFLNVPYNVVTMNHPIRHTLRALGFCYGRLKR